MAGIALLWFSSYLDECLHKLIMKKFYSTDRISNRSEKFYGCHLISMRLHIYMKLLSKIIKIVK